MIDIFQQGWITPLPYNLFIGPPRFVSTEDFPFQYLAVNRHLEITNRRIRRQRKEVAALDGARCIITQALRQVNLGQYAIDRHIDQERLDLDFIDWQGQRLGLWRRVNRDRLRLAAGRSAANERDYSSDD